MNSGEHLWVFCFSGQTHMQKNAFWAATLALPCALMIKCRRLLAKMSRFAAFWFVQESSFFLPP